MSENEKVENPQRRDFLGSVTAAVGVGGAAAACWPFINSMNPSLDAIAKGKTEVDLSHIPVGGMHTVVWQGKPVFIVHRSEEEIKKAEAATSQMDPATDQKRVQQPQWLVVVGVCTHLGCVPNRNDEGWLCACHGSEYDESGRVVRGPAPKNLEVPPYKFVSADKIIIG
jgi:ubiquinol-cytochrome c reductase iron-sulfur subunit